MKWHICKICKTDLTITKEGRTDHLRNVHHFTAKYPNTTYYFTMEKYLQLWK